MATSRLAPLIVMSWDRLEDESGWECGPWTATDDGQLYFKSAFVGQFLSPRAVASDMQAVRNQAPRPS